MTLIDKPGTYSAKIELIDTIHPTSIDPGGIPRPMWYVTQPEVGQTFEYYLYLHKEIDIASLYNPVFHGVEKRVETSIVEGIIRHSHYGEPTHFSITTMNSIYRVTDIRRKE